MGATHIVAIWILDKRQGVVRDLADELHALRLGRVVDAALQDAAAVAMSRDLDAVGRDGIVNELVVLRRELVETLLDDVVAVEVLDQNDDVQTQSDDDRVDLECRK